MNEDYAALLNELEFLCRFLQGDDNALEAAACIRAIEIIEAIRNDRHAPAQEPDDATCEALIESSDMRWNGDHYYGDGGDLMDLVRAAMLAAIAKGGE